MPKRILKDLFVICFIFLSTIAILNPGYSMKEANDDIDSATRKISRISPKIQQHLSEPHDFVGKNKLMTIKLDEKSVKSFNKSMPGTIERSQQMEQDNPCTTCGKKKEECLGNNGGRSNKIKEKAKLINSLLAEIEKELK